MHTPRGPSQTIHVSNGEVFVITLAGNPTTGYLWLPSLDGRCLDLLAQEYQPDSPAVGAAGHEVFHLLAKTKGETVIQFEYRRPWDAEARDRRDFLVVIE